LEFAMGGGPLNGASHPPLSSSLYTDYNTEESYLRLTCPVRIGLTNTTVVAQGSSDLQTWTSGPTQVGAAIPQGDGTALVTWQDDVPLSAALSGKRFLRLQITTP